MAKKKEEEVVVVVEAPAVAVEETPVVETPKKASRSNGVDVPKPQPEQIGHTTRAFHG